MVRIKARLISGFIGVLLFSISCKKENAIEPVHFPNLMEIPSGFPDIMFPSDNEFTEERWTLGKKLFYDPIMSVDSTLSCASCHRQELAFADDVTFSLGVEQRLGTRNAPSLANVAYHPYFTREGGLPTLEMQVLVPIQEHNEFDFNIVLIGEKLVQDPNYVAMSQAAYNRSPNPFVITRALACFERSLLSGNSPYDQHLNHSNRAVLTNAEIRGMELFFSEKTNCSKCHGGFNFTNYAFENNGLYEQYEDEGRFRLTGEASDLALFKVPSLRNVALTAPYMHDGSLNSLKKVIEHYQSGGKNHVNKSELIEPFELSETEINDLVQFLNSLTDESFVTNPIFKN